MDKVKTAEMENPLTCLEKSQVRHVGWTSDPYPTAAFVAPRTFHGMSAVCVLRVCSRLGAVRLNICCLDEEVCRVPVMRDAMSITGIGWV